MSAPAKMRFKLPSPPGTRFSWIIGAVLVIVAVVFAARYLRSYTPAADDYNSYPTPIAPSSTAASSSSVNQAVTASSSSVNRSVQNEQIPEGDLLRGLSGEYRGSIELSEAGISGEATLIISAERFRLQPARGRQISGHLAAKNMGEYVDLKVTFDERTEPVPQSSLRSNNIVTANYNLAQLPSLSLQATLPSEGEGWLIRNAPGEKHEVMFMSTNCPRYPYCKPVRRCRPCEP